MSLTIETQPIAIPDTLMSDMDAAVAQCEGLLKSLVDCVYEKVAVDGRVKSDRIEAEQHLTHGLAWVATYVEALKEMRGYTRTMSSEGRFGEMESLVTRIAFAEYLAQIFGGIPMTQVEFVRLADFGVSAETITAAQSPEVTRLMSEGNTKEIRTRLVALMEAAEGTASFGDAGLDETMEAFRDEMSRFAESEVTPHAHEWHLKDAYIPMEIIEQMAEMGVFGLTIPEDYGGLGLGKESMCVVSEALSRAFIGVGSLGTRSEIAAELILCGGTEKQKQKWLPMIASGEILPTAVFTEPNTGSDLASLKTRATLDGETYKVTGNKTWITHPVRADLMTLLVFGTTPARASRRIGYVPQHPRLDPLFPVTALDVALMGRLGTTPTLGPWRGKDRQAALDALAEVGLADQAQRHFADLSGGQKQRVLIARALAGEPDLLLLDEPTAGLDAHVEEGFYRLLQELNKRLTIIMVSHDLGFVSGYVKSVVCVGREVLVHPTSAINGQIIADLYGSDMRLVRHDHRCSEEGHQC